MHVRTSGFVVARRFEAAGAVDGWLDDRREASAARTVGVVVGWLADGLDDLFERLDCNAGLGSGLTCEPHTWSGPIDPERSKRPYVRTLTFTKSSSSDSDEEDVGRSGEGI